MDEPKVYAYSGAINSLAEILGSEGIRSVFVYADRNTYEAAGRRAVEILESAGIKAKEYIFKAKRVEPNETTVGLAAMSFDPSVDAVLGVGSGVINDVSKIIANNSGKKYIILATAPSMDGYASAASSMSVEGLKISLPSKCADIIIGDIDIIKNAPMKMMLAGLGDMLAKYTAICEWRISNIINGEPISEEIAESVRESLQRCVKNAEGLIRREPAATEAVFEGLVLCGLAMKRAGSSRPASGIEHYLSHIWDMRGEEFGTPTDLHGLQCAVGTYISVSLFEKIKSVKINKEKALAFVEHFDYAKWARELRGFLGKGAEAMITLEEKEGKYDKEKHKARLDTIIRKWDEILAVINEELPSLDSLTALYGTVGMPTTLGQIGQDEDVLPMTLMAAKDIRDKYVLSHLFWDLGISTEELFAEK
jgi:glycerol-1-phosphate dehydrogenase [NAD(P)+]